MGCGKSTFGRLLADTYHLSFHDLDEIIEIGEGKSIVEIFESEGEEAFRNLETQYLKQFETKDNYILSCGGGTPCFNNNIEYLNTISKTIFLDVPVKELVKRLFNDKNRPLLIGKSKEELESFISFKLEERNPFYKQAQIILKEATKEAFEGYCK